MYNEFLCIINVEFIKMFVIRKEYVWNISYLGWNKLWFLVFFIDWYEIEMKNLIVLVVIRKLK